MKKKKASLQYLHYWHIFFYLGTCVKYETSFLYFSCVNSSCGLSGNVSIGDSLLVPPVIKASFSRSKSAVDKTLNDVSWKTCSIKNKKQKSSIKKTKN
jgi:hypothetical protein